MNLRHNAVRNFIHNKGSMVYNDTEIKPKLRPVEDQTLKAGANITEGARSDVRIMNFGRPFQNTHFDVKVINAQARTHLDQTPEEALVNSEHNKNRAYKKRVEKVENAAFIPLIFTSRGARSKATGKSNIVNKIAAKRKEEKSEVSKGLLTELSFIFVKMELACITGHRKPRTAEPNN